MIVEMLSAGLLLAATATALPTGPRRYIHFAFVFVAFETYLIVGPRAAWIVAAAGALGAAVRVVWSRRPGRDQSGDLDVAVSLAATAMASAAGLVIADAIARALRMDYPVPIAPLAAVSKFFVLLAVLFGVVALIKMSILRVVVRVESTTAAPPIIRSRASHYFGTGVVAAPMHYLAHSFFLSGGTLAWACALGWAFLFNAIIARELDSVRRIQRLTQQLARNERLIAVGEVTARMAHQARHQLGLMGIAAHRIEKHASSLAGDQAGVVRAELAKLEEVQRELSDMFTRNLRGPVVPRDEEFQPSYAEVIAAVVRRLEPLAETRGVRVVLGGLEPAAKTRPLNAENVSQGFFNVLENALVAAGAAVRLEAEARGETLVVSVTDDGPGLEPSALDRATEPFFTTKPEGTGMGLAIARAAMEEEGGALRVSNRPQGGCCVEIAVPTGSAPRYPGT